jgi:hypothetical protein
MKTFYQRSRAPKARAPSSLKARALPRAKATGIDCSANAPIPALLTYGSG